MKEIHFKIVIALLVIVAISSLGLGGFLQAPPGMFKDLTDEILGDAIILRSKQLFIDDYIIEELKGAEKILNQPKKHPKNPLIVADKAWERDLGYSSVIYDKEEGFFKMWYGAWSPENDRYQNLCYATSPDGIRWRKPITTQWSAKEHNNIVFGYKQQDFNCAGVFKDMQDSDDSRRYKMLYSDYPDGTSKTASTSVAFSPDGIEWTRDSRNPLIPFSDSQCAPLRDEKLGRYVAYLRYGPPNRRLISRIESEDFVHWSPKIKVVDHTKMDDDNGYGYTSLYCMRAMPYEGVYIGLLSAYRDETLSPIPKDKLYKDKTDVQLTFSRNGLTWNRVGKHGTIDMSREHDWKTLTKEATFLPYGRHKVDWDWGQVYPHHMPIVVGDEIWIYYAGYANRHHASYHGDTIKSGIGLAKLRLDGFVSINAEDEGTMTTKPFVFVGDTIEINTNATGGPILVEASDEKGKVIEGFSKNDCQPITSNNVRHIVKWTGGVQVLPRDHLELKLSDPEVLFSAGFEEAEGYVLGNLTENDGAGGQQGWFHQSWHDRGGWSNYDTAVVNDKAHSGTQSVKIDVGARFITYQHAIEEKTTGFLTVSCYTYLEKVSETDDADMSQVTIELMDLVDDTGQSELRYFGNRILAGSGVDTLRVRNATDIGVNLLTQTNAGAAGIWVGRKAVIDIENATADFFLDVDDAGWVQVGNDLGLTPQANGATLVDTFVMWHEQTYTGGVPVQWVDDIEVSWQTEVADGSLANNEGARKYSSNCQLIQGRPIKLKFYMEKEKLYSFTPRIRHTHYIPSYD